MAFIINTTTVANNRPNVSYSIIINRPTTIAQTSTRHANSTLGFSATSLTGNVLVI
jgi:hypothetical protein